MAQRSEIGRRHPPVVGPRVVGLGLVLAMLWLAPGHQAAAAELNSEALATRIAESLNTLRDPRYKTVAFSRIRQAGTRVNVDEVIDFANVKLVRGRRLQVVDRSKLQLILREQKVHLSDFVSATKYRELGQLAGVDLFVYGTVYRDALVLKAIDVQNSAIAWADVFPIGEDTREADLLRRLGEGVVLSMRNDLERLRAAKIRLVSFWNIDVPGAMPQEAVMDFLSVALTREGSLKVVDRENLELIVGEQKLSQAEFIDEKRAKRLGELYGVDGFIYGAISERDGNYIASMKMMNIFNGVIAWADLIKMEAGAGKGEPGAVAGGGGAPAVPGMAYIPEGEFVMGANGVELDSRPAHQVTVRKGYYLDTGEVSNAEYLKFVRSRGHRAPYYWAGGNPRPGEEGLPVVGVTWEDARKYCRFVGKRLPSEAEWEKAARGTGGQTYPWAGTSFSPSFTVTVESGRKAPVEVDAQNRDLSPYGVRHLGGNVREWVNDAFLPYTGAAKDPRHEREKVVRGGSWATTSAAARTFFRGSSNPNNVWPDVGFRCAKALGE
ncbi:MAG: SUMF1/EgtB/PvdO family nonheme iron enzyme [Candidatus Lambdaproteobacteria bacterium]|nr:SUMF1/EgtB/PvdO family nonheme iron enzyme [Candidatus Lambdaproteobacteria bacterium]